MYFRTKLMSLELDRGRVRNLLTFLTGSVSPYLSIFENVFICREKEVEFYMHDIVSKCIECLDVFS